MAKHFNCSKDEKWLDCLRTIDAKDILKYAQNGSEFSVNPLEETEFLPFTAQNAFRNKKYNSGY